MSYQAVILTVSDSCAAGTRTDTSGPAIRAIPVAMWVEGLKSTPRAMLSRAVAGARGAYACAERPGLGKGGARKSRRRRRDARSCTQNARGRRALTSKKHVLRLQRVLFHFF